MKLVECVPNFSEGRRPEVISAIADVALLRQPADQGKPEKSKNVWVLDTESDPDHNRMLVTLVGEPEAVLEAVWKMVKKATELIDMEKHKGEHPRIGATDVVPFIPVSEVSMRECIGLAKRLAKKVGQDLKIPVYLYEAAATRPDRVNLADIRKGEYEGLKKEMGTNPDRKPDFGPAMTHPTAGAIVIGARKFLIAFNVNLDTKDIQIAKDIAQIVREKDGGFPAVKALGFEIQEKGCTQISMNLCDFEKTNMDKVFRKIKKEAEKRGVRVLGAEIYGMVPKSALRGINLEELQLVDFKEEQILENRLPA